MSQLPPAIQEFFARVLFFCLLILLLLAVRRVVIWLILQPLRVRAKRTPGTSDDLLIELVVIPTRYLLLAVGLWLGAEIFSLQPGGRIFIDQIIRMLAILALFTVSYRAVDVFTPSARKLFGLTGVVIEDQLLPFIRTGLKLVLIAFALVIIVQIWGYDVGGLIAGLGVGGLAVALAAQDTLSNLFGFTMIVGDRPFVVGDYIKTPDVEGLVEHVGLRSTRVRQMDQALVSVPNSKLAGSAVLNWSRLNKRWINFTLNLNYDTTSSSLLLVMERIRTMLAEREHVQTDSILVNFIEFGESGLRVMVRCYVQITDWGAFTREREAINIEIMKLLAGLRIHIAYPTTTMYVESLTDDNEGLFGGQQDEQDEQQKSRPASG